MDFKQHLRFVSNLRKSPHLLPHITVVAAVLIYALIQLQHFTPAYQEVDPDGYLFLAKRIARLQSPAVQDDDPFMYQTHQWVETPSGKVISKFSPGYPLLMAIAYRIGGDEAMFVVSPLMGGLTLIGAYLLFQLWMSPLVAALGIWALAVNPMFDIYSGYLLTHASNVCAVTWGMYFLWKWVRGDTGKSGVWAGLLLGLAVTIRHTSALMSIVVLIAAIKRWRQTPLGMQNLSFRKSVGVLLGCYAIFPVFLAIYNWTIFGNPLITGYSLTQEQDAFSFEHLRHNLVTMVSGLNTTALLLIFPIGLAGMLTTGDVWERLMRLFWFLPTALLYTATTGRHQACRMCGS